MFRSIPQIGGVLLAPLDVSLLPSTMVVRSPIADSEYGDEWTEPATIEHVRFARSTEFNLLSNGSVQSGYMFQDGSKGLVYVDAANSVGAFEVPEQSEVSIDGGEMMEVVKVTRHDNFDGSCHHWEIEVR